MIVRIHPATDDPTARFGIASAEAECRCAIRGVVVVRDLALPVELVRREVARHVAAVGCCPAMAVDVGRLAIVDPAAMTRGAAVHFALRLVKAAGGQVFRPLFGPVVVAAQRPPTAVYGRAA